MFPFPFAQQQWPNDTGCFSSDTSMMKHERDSPQFVDHYPFYDPQPAYDGFTQISQWYVAHTEAHPMIHGKCFGSNSSSFTTDGTATPTFGTLDVSYDCNLTASCQMPSCQMLIIPDDPSTNFVSPPQDDFDYTSDNSWSASGIISSPSSTMSPHPLVPASLNACTVSPSCLSIALPHPQTDITDDHPKKEDEFKDACTSPVTKAPRPCKKHPPSSVKREGDNGKSERRKIEDQILLDGRQKNLPFRIIRKSHDFGVTESTLRGRYRSLTKPRSERPRKPKWTPIDIELLQQAVPLFPHRSGRGQISWKSVSEYISNNGGTHSFAYKTCCRKWREINGQEAQR